MANQRWYPQPTGNRGTDEAFRQAFDGIYALRDKTQAPTKGAAALKSSTSVQVTESGQIALVPVGPGAGTYVVGAKLTGGGQNGTITIDAYGRVTAIQLAT